MNILIIINSLTKGGAEKLIETIAPLFQKKSNQVSVLLFNLSTTVHEYLKTLKDSGVEVIIPKKDKIYHPSNILFVRKIILENNFDIVHAHLFPASYFTAFAKILLPKNKKQIPFIFTEHSNNNRRRDKLHFKYSEKLVYKQFDKVIAIAQEVKNNLDKWLGNTQKTIVIPNGVAIQKIFDEDPINREELCQSLSIKDDAILLLMSARFMHPKNQKAIIRALHLLPPNIHLLLAGEGPEIENVKSFAMQSNLNSRVHFLGFRTDVTRLMKAVDFNILSSFYEGMSGVALEALASGVAFIGSDVAGINDIVPDKRYLFPSDDEKVLAEKINYLIHRPEEKMQMESDALNFVQQFDIHKMVDNYLALYKQLIAAKTK